MAKVVAIDLLDEDNPVFEVAPEKSARMHSNAGGVVFRKRPRDDTAAALLELTVCGAQQAENINLLTAKLAEQFCRVENRDANLQFQIDAVDGQIGVLINQVEELADSQRKMMRLVQEVLKLRN